MIKPCSRCTNPKDTDLNEYGWDKTAKRWRSACRQCENAAHRVRDANYRMSKDKRYYERQRRAQKKRSQFRVAEARAYVNNLKKKPCTDCLSSYPTSFMHFDHLDPATKTANVAALVSKGKKLDRIKEEIAKCELVCGECHIKRTLKRRWEPL